MSLLPDAVGGHTDGVPYCNARHRPASWLTSLMTFDPLKCGGVADTMALCSNLDGVLSESVTFIGGRKSGAVALDECYSL